MQQVKWLIKVTVSRDFGLWLIFQCNPPICKTLSWSVRNSYGANCLVFTHLQSALGVLGAWYKGCMRCVRRGMVKGPKHVFCKYICFKLENLSKYDLHINFVLSPPPPPTPHLAKRWTDLYIPFVSISISREHGSSNRRNVKVTISRCNMMMVHSDRFRFISSNQTMFVKPKNVVKHPETKHYR